MHKYRTAIFVAGALVAAMALDWALPVLVTDGSLRQL
jgi:hypothetical protein